MPFWHSKLQTMFLARGCVMSHGSISQEGTARQLHREILLDSSLYFAGTPVFRIRWGESMHIHMEALLLAARDLQACPY